jgi:hypothetical protein
MVPPRDLETKLELVRVANEMRRNREPIEDRHSRRILYMYYPSSNTAQELKETLSAVPAGDSWETYLWLDGQQTAGANPEERRMRHDFTRAMILEIEGKRPEALAAFQSLRGELKRHGYDGRIATHVDDAIARLSRSGIR